MRMMKRGAVEWTMGKLLAIVLAVVLLTIIIFGWSNAVVPLYERVETRIGEILILLNIRDGGDDFGDIDCIDDKLVDMDRGILLLDVLGIEGLSRDLVTFEKCRTGRCFFRDKGPFGAYLFVNGNLFKEIVKGEKYNLIKTSAIDADNARFYSDLYKEVWKLSDDDDFGVKDFFEGKITRQFVFYGNGEGWGEPVYMIWGNNYWLIKRYEAGTKTRRRYMDGVYITVSEGTAGSWDTKYSGNNEANAISTFMGIVGGWDEDEIHYGFSYPTKDDSDIGAYSSKDKSWAPIKNIPGIGGTEIEKNEIDDLRAWFDKKGKEAIAKTFEDTSSVDKLKALIDGKTLNIDGVDYGLEYKNDGGVPVVMVGDKHRLSLNPSVMVDKTFNNIAGDSFADDPSFVNIEVLVNNKWKVVPDSLSYDLSTSDAVNQYNVNKIKEFLVKECR